MALPRKYRYRIIFMERDLDEVLASQHRMLVRQGKASAGVYPLKLAQNYRNVIEKVKGTIHYRPNVQVLFFQPTSWVVGFLSVPFRSFWKVQE